MDPAEISGDNGGACFFQIKKGTEFLYSDPSLRLTVCFHVLLQHVEDYGMTGQDNRQFARNSDLEIYLITVIDSAGHVRNGGVRLLQPHRIRSSRNL